MYFRFVIDCQEQFLRTLFFYLQQQESLQKKCSLDFPCSVLREIKKIGTQKYKKLLRITTRVWYGEYMKLLLGSTPPTQKKRKSKKYDFIFNCMPMRDWTWILEVRIHLPLSRKRVSHQVWVASAMQNALHQHYTREASRSTTPSPTRRSNNWRWSCARSHRRCASTTPCCWHDPLVPLHHRVPACRSAHPWHAHRWPLPACGRP
jgi:hypothetical protein